MLAKVWGKGNIIAVLAEMWNYLGNSIEVSQKFFKKLLYDPATLLLYIFHIWYMKEMELLSWSDISTLIIHYRSIHNSQDMKMTQPSFDLWMDKENVQYTQTYTQWNITQP